MSLENDLVAIDRSGDPIYFLVTSASLPDIPQSTVYKVYDYIKAAVDTYYKHNTYRGCTDRDAPNFSFIANENDGTCKPPNTNYTFGGVYQTCTGTGYTDLCQGMKQKNPLTGDNSCPEEYEAIKLQDGSKHSSITRRECHSCWLFFHCCHDKTYYASAQYTAYWCAAKGHVDQNHGYLFGGLYTKTSFNPMTEDMSCPLNFYALRLLDNLVICVSDDYELGLEYSLPFAGFYSCKSGNPLSLRTNGSLQSSGNQHTLMTYMLNQGPSSWPHECPHGFSQHLAVVDNGCEINYCIKSGALSAQRLPKIKRPPFMQLPHDSYLVNQEAFVFNDDGTVWTSLSDANEQFPKEFPWATTAASGSGQHGASNGGKAPEASLSAGAAAGLAVVCTLAAVLMLVVAIAVYRKRKGCGLYRQTDAWDQKPLTSESSHQRSGSYGGFQQEITITQT